MKANNPFNTSKRSSKKKETSDAVVILKSKVSLESLGKKKLADASYKKSRNSKS